MNENELDELKGQVTATTEQGLLRLIEAAVHEGKTIEYKREIAVSKDEQKRKFVRSIASFANASGGKLIFGMEAEKGKPVGIRPLRDFEPDGDVLRLRDIIRAHIQPQLLGCELKPVKVQGGWALVAHVSRSWNPPHMVTFGGDNRFYTRDANGFVPMSVPEIREAFFARKTVKERIQQYRCQRLSAIRSDELPMNPPPQAIAVLHALPFRSFADDYQVDLGPLTDQDLYPPTKWESSGRRYDIDGIYGQETRNDGRCGNYIFVSRSGCLEALTTAGFPVGQGKFISNPHFEKQFIDFMPRCIDLLRKLWIEPPVALAVTLLDVKGFVLYFGTQSALYFTGLRPLQQRDLILPPTVITTYDQPVSRMLKPICDALWRSCGLQQSFNFDKDENWVGKESL